MGLFKRVALGISGGVDSAVAGKLLKDKGYEVVGIFMRNWDIRDESGKCSVDADVEHAEWTCKKLEIPFHQVNFVKEYWLDVFSQFVKDYESGYTPNPDVQCNKLIKFKHFLNHAQETVGADAIATGHYARSSFGNYLENFSPGEDARLFSSKDTVKDQTLFLCQIPQLALRRTMFPLGDLLKSEVREIAINVGLGQLAKKRESMGICFIGKREFSGFISQYIADKDGVFIDIETGEKIGHHSGIHRFTVGQQAKISGGPWRYYVCKKDATKNILYVARYLNHPAHFSRSFTVGSIQWISKAPAKLLSTGKIVCDFRFQHIDPLVKCVLTCVGNAGAYKIELENPLRALTPGQFAVFYLENECLGAGVIDQVGPTLYDLNEEGCREKLMESLMEWNERKLKKKERRNPKLKEIKS